MPQHSALLPDTIDAAINYYQEPPNGEPYQIVILGRAQARKQKFNTQFMPIRDMRSVTEKFHFDIHGFDLVKYSGRAGLREETFDDEQKIKANVYDEVRDMVKKNTGATYVHIYNHIVRREPYSVTDKVTQDTPDLEKVNGTHPAMLAHIDQSYRAAYEVLDRMPGPEGQLLRNKSYKNRWALVNVWKPLRTVTREPLAVCDARSVAETDLRPVTLRTLAEDNIIEGVQRDIGLWYIAHNSQHRWYWPSHQRPDEALIIKQYDSARDGRAVRTPHSAIKTPSDSGPPRQSIELRMVVFWEEDLRESRL